jgi:hypothetical protein
MNLQLMTLPKVKQNLMAKLDRLIILRDEFHRALTNPLFDEPENYCVLLDVIQDAIDKEESNA